MRKFTHCCVFMLVLCFSWLGMAQSQLYTFTHQIGTYTPNSTNATEVPALKTNNSISTSLPIGFTFNYGGLNYTNFYMSSNGIINFGATGLSTATNNLSTANTANRPILAVLWDAMSGNSTESKASYEVTGTAPNRVLTVEWSKWRWNASATQAVISFQVKLYETTNIIEYVYQREAAAINGTGSATIGIGNASGSGVGSFVNLAAAIDTPSISTASVTSIKEKPANNQVFKFTPPACYYPGIVTITGATVNSAIVNLSQPFNVPIEIYFGDQVPTTTSVATATIPAGTTNLLVTGLSSSKKYNVYFRYTCAGTTTAEDWRESEPFYTLCDVFAGSFSENFDTTETGSTSNNTFPYCWNYLDEISSTGYGFVEATTTNSLSKPNAYKIYRTNSAANEDLNVVLISPETVDLGNGTKQLRFSVKATSATATNKLEIVTSDGITSTDNFTVLTTLTINNTSYKEYIIPIAATTDDFFGFRLVHNGETSASTIYLDDIHFEDAAPCIYPIGLVATGITTTTATISWNPSIGAGVVGYDYEIRTSGDAGSGAVGFVTSGTTGTTSVALTGLTASNTYYVYVRSTCGTSNGDWTLIPIMFNTLCTVQTGNFSEDFEAALRGSASNNTFPLCWSYVDEINSTGYGFIDIANVKNGKQSYRLYRTNTTANEDQNVILISPETTDLGNGTKQIRFSVRATAVAVDNVLEIVRANGTSATSQFSVIQTININHTAYKEYIIPLAATTDDYFGFRLVHNGTTTATTLNFDDIFYEDLSACSFPIGQKISNITLNSAVLTFNPSLSAGVTGYEYEVRTSGAAGSGAVGLLYSALTSNTTVTLTNLAASTDYFVYVRSLCNGTPGLWSDYPSEFMTLCPVQTGSFSENFDTTKVGSANINTYPKCWSYIDEITSTGSGFVGTTFPISGKNAYRFYRTNSTANRNDNLILVSPETANLGAGTKQVRFSVRNNSGTNKDIIEVVTLDKNDNTATVSVIQAINVIGTTYKEFIVPLPANSDDYFGLRLAHNGTTTATTIFIDDVHYEDISDCIFPMNIKVANITANTANLSWNSSLAKGVTAYEYEIRTSGLAGSGSTGLIKTGTVNTTSVALTGLPHSTKYYVYVRSVCGTSNGAWTIYPIDFSTLCDVYTTGFYESFEIYDEGSVTNNNYPYCWSYVDNVTTTGYGFIEEDSAVSGKNSYRLYRTNSATNANQKVVLISPETDNLGNGNGLKQIRFSVQALSSTAINKLEIVSINGTSLNATYTVLDTFYIDHTTAKEYIVVLPQTTDDYFGFRLAYNGATSVSDINIDDIYYEDAPNCKDVDFRTITTTAITKDGFTVNWQDQFNVNVPYVIEILDVTAASVVQTVTTPANATSFVISGLNPSTEYRITVKAVCSATDQSNPSDAVSVVTLCNYPDFTSHTPVLTLCGAQVAELSAVVADPNGIAVWYDTATSIAPLFEGPIFVSDTIVSQDRSFFLRSKIETDGVPVQVGEGTNTGNSMFTFVAGGWGGFKHQYIFTAAELKEWGLVAGPISALKFDILTAGQAERNNFTLSIASTTKTMADGNHIDNSLFTPVYSNAALALTVGMFTFDFNAPFIWDGVSNIVIQTNWSNETTNNTNGNIAYHEADVELTTYTRGDLVTSASLLNVINGGALRADGTTHGGTFISKMRPNTIFVGTGICESPAIEIPVRVEAKPLFEISTDKVVSCEDGISDVVTITVNQGNYDTFVWTPSTGVSGDAVNGWTFNSAQEQVYTLIASQANGICEEIKTVRVLAGTKPVPNPALASTFDVCKNTMTMLNVITPVASSLTVGQMLTTTNANEEISAYLQSTKYSKQQYIYKASELIALGGNKPGYITSLSFETINSGASLKNDQYTVKLMLSANTTFNGTNFYTGNFTTVFNKLNYTHTFSGTQQFNFDVPFYWDGVSNIIVEIVQEGQGSGNNAQTYFNTSIGSGNVGMYATNTTSNNLLTGTGTEKRLDVNFNFGQTEVTWSPATNLYLDAAGTVLYAQGSNMGTVYALANTSTVYTATLTAPNGCVVTKDYTFNSIDVPTPVITNQNFCKVTLVTDVIIANVPANGTVNFYNSATSIATISTISTTNTYYVEFVVGNCKSVRVPFNAVINNLGLPTAAFKQTVCGTSTVANLQATGTNGAQIVWYDSQVSTNALALTQPLVDQQTYYAAQVVNGCESARVAVLVTIGQAPVALAAQSISICGALNFGSVQLNQLAGAELVWYQSTTSQTPIPNSNQILTGTYYVAQKIGACESSRVQVVATTQGAVKAPNAVAQIVCGGGTVAQLTASALPTATLEWYLNTTDLVPLQATTVLTSGTYYVAQRVGNCISNKVAVSVRVTSSTAPVVKPFVLCEGAQVIDLVIPSTTSVTYNWYLNSTSTSVLPATQVLQNGYYFVTRVENGCESVRSQVQVTIGSKPNSPTGISPQSFVDYAEISNIVMDQANVLWYATYDDAMNGKNQLPQNIPLVDGTTYYAVFIGSNGCVSLPTAIDIVITLGTNDFDLTMLRYWPNPVNDVLSISYKEAILEVQVFDLNGRLVITKQFNETEVQLDFAHLSSATYMLNIKTKENSQFVKVVKK